MEPGKAWHILSNRWNSAITEYALSAARSLKARGWHTVISPLAGSPAERRARGYDLETVSFKSFDLTQCLAFRRLGQELRPDLVFVYGGPETFLLHSLCHSSVNLKLRARADELEKKLGSVRTRLAQMSVDGVVTPSRRFEEHFSKICEIPVKCVPLGISGQDFCFQEDLYRPQPDKIVMTLLGRFDPVKGHQKIFRLCRRLKDSYPSKMKDLFLQIIGEEANLSTRDMVNMADKEGLVLNLDYGIIDHRLDMYNLRNILINSAIGVISSLASEIICRVGEEFLVAGVPLVVSGVGSLEELLFAGAGRTYRGMTDSEIISLLKETILASAMEPSPKRRQRATLAQHLFSLESMGASLESFYLALKDKKRL